MNQLHDAVVSTNLPLGPPIRGKVRDCYRLPSGRHGDAMLIVSTDRISAFDWILPTPIPDKGRVLTAISAFWFDLFSRGSDPVPHHLITTDVDDMDLPSGIDRGPLRGRTMLVRRAEVIPFECVVRGWLAGSALAEYRASGTVWGEPLPAGLVAGGRGLDRRPGPWDRSLSLRASARRRSLYRCWARAPYDFRVRA